MSPIVLALLLRQTSVQDVKVAAMPLEKAIQRVSEIYHSPMTVSNLLKDKIILISATQVSEAEVRDQIAKVVDASWEMKDSGWHLGQSPKQLTFEKQRRFALRSRMLRKTLEARSKSPSTSAIYDEGFASKNFHQMANSRGSFLGIPDSQYGLPEQRLMSRFLFKFDPNKIASADSGERVVFSLRPNAMQLPLDVSLQADIAQFRTESAIWKKTIEKLRKDPESKIGRKQRGNEEDEESPVTGETIEDTMPSDVGNVLFTVFSEESTGTEMSLIFLPTNPKEPYFTISASTSEAFFAGMTDADFAQKPSADFKLSQVSDDFQKFLGGQREEIQKDRLEANLKLFADPVTRDPLSYGLTEAISFDARKVNKNIIAVIGDESIRIAEPTFAETYFQDRFNDLIGDIIAKEGNWIRLNSLPFEGPVFPRHDLKRIIARIRLNKYVGLEDRAEIAALKPRGRRESTIDYFIYAFVSPTRAEGGDPDALRTLGMLLEVERNRAMSPTGISFGQLNAKLQRHLFECVYYNYRNTLALTESSKIDEESIVANETTLLAPNGISNASVFRIDQSHEDMIRCSMKDNPDGLVMSASGWGSMKFRLEHSKEYGGEDLGVDSNVKLFRVRMNMFDFRLTINADCEWTSHLEKLISINEPSFTLANIPNDLIEEFKAGYKAAEEELKDMKEQKKKDGDGGNKN